MGWDKNKPNDSKQPTLPFDHRRGGGTGWAGTITTATFHDANSNAREVAIMAAQRACFQTTSMTRRFQTSYFPSVFEHSKRFACSCEHGYIAGLLPPSSTTCRLRTCCTTLLSLVPSTKKPFVCNCKLVRVYIRETSASRPRVHTSKFSRVHARPRPSLGSIHAQTAPKPSRVTLKRPYELDRGYPKPR